MKKLAFWVAQWKESASNAGDAGSIAGLEDTLEEEMATRSSILAGKTPWTEEAGRLQYLGTQKNRTQLSDWHECMEKAY